MCGILAFLGQDNAVEHILSGLLQLQNRGYDSAGLAFFENKKIQCYKYSSNSQESALTKLKPLKEQHKQNLCGIGHTRWATHGPKTDNNSHPHKSNDGLFYLVHNGIIENFKELKKFLIEKKFSFESQTDTEVIVQLLSYHYSLTNNVRESIEKTMFQLKGTWGLAILFEKEPNTIYCTRHGSPLLVGIEEDKVVITSEQNGFCNLFTKYIVLNNQDICKIERKDNQIKVSTTDTYEKKMALNNKGGLTPFPYAHWTLKEIHEQVDSSLRAISLGGRLRSTGEVKLGGVSDKKQEILELDNIIILGCGTSYHAGMIGRDYMKEICEFNTIQLFDGADFTIKDIPKRGKTGLILLSQSGETKDLHRCIQIAHENNLLMIGVVNVVDSLIAREVDCGCYLNAGREVGVASTKAFTSQIIVLSMLAIWFAQIKNVCEIKRKRMIMDLRNLYLDIEKTIATSFEVINEELLQMFDNCDHTFILGKRKCESIAKEGALKIKEISYIHAEGYSTGSLKHGPFALLRKDFPVILLGPKDNQFEKTINAYEEIKSREANILMITNNEEFEGKRILIPTNKSFQELLCVIPLQVIAYKLSLRKGLNPDMPRNLAKVVTVE